MLAKPIIFPPLIDGFRYRCTHPTALLRSQAAEQSTVGSSSAPAGSVHPAILIGCPVARPSGRTGTRTGHHAGTGSRATHTTAWGRVYRGGSRRRRNRSGHTSLGCPRALAIHDGNRGRTGKSQGHGDYDRYDCLVHHFHSKVRVLSFGGNVLLSDSPQVRNRRYTAVFRRMGRGYKDTSRSWK